MFYIIGALFAIVIGVILMINVMGGGSQASSGSQVATTVNEINQIRTGVKMLGYRNDFADIGNYVLETGGVMPPELIAGAIGAGDDLDTWGGPFSVGNYCYSYPNTPCYQVTVELVPASACVALASQVTIPAAISGLVSYAVDINGVAYGKAGQAITPAQAAAVCTPGSSLSWFFND